MKNFRNIAILSFIIILLYSGCNFFAGEHMTTEKLRQRLEGRYGTGNFKIEEIKSKSWEISLLKYPDIKYTIREKIGISSMLPPLPEYKISDDRMEKVGNLVAPKYFTADEMKSITYLSGMMEIKWDLKDEKDVAELSAKLKNFCEDMQENYSQVVNDAVVNVFFLEPPFTLPDLGKIEAAQWGDLEAKDISAYLDSTYGAGCYTYNKSESLSHDGKIEVRLTDYPDVPFYLAVQKSNFGFKKAISDTRYHDVSVYVANAFPKADYDDSQFLEVKAAERIYGFALNGFYLGRYFELKKEKELISKMQVMRQELRKHIDQQPMLIYTDFPKNKHKVKPPILMKLSIRL